MELKIRFLNWIAGIPVAMLNYKTAAEIGVHPKDRVLIKTLDGEQRSFTTIIDTVKGFVKENEIVVSSEIKERLKLKSRQKVDVSLAEIPRSLEYIKRKLTSKKFSKEEIFEIIEDVVSNSLSESEIAMFVSAMYQKGMSFKELVYLIEAILESGNKLSLRDRIIVDKHCVGGLPGNRTTPIIVSICAAVGLTFPKTSSRAITSAAGTADVIETVAKVDFTMDELKKIIKKTNACMVWGGSLGLVPADAKIIQIEKALKIDPKSQLLASIISKKLAVGSTHILIDIPYGKTAKISNIRRAISLKRDFEKLGRYFKKKLRCVLTDGSQPIGNGVGPVLEMMDIIKVLNPKERGPRDLEEKGIFLAGEILELTDKAERGKGKEIAREILYSGKAFRKFREIVKAQKGKINGLKFAKFKKDILATRKLKIKEIDNHLISSLARVAGSPVDKAAGVYIHVHLNDELKKGEKILTVYSESKSRLKEALKFYKKEKVISFR
jgi:putative thymidine phosphorylase